jgi:cystathionine gamma-synthase
MIPDDARPETLAVHAGRHTDPVTGAVVPPIHLSTTFERDEHNALRSQYLYSRYANPTRDALEEALTILEGGAATAAFASGLGAAHAALMLLSPGDHIILPDDVYSGVRSLAHTLFGPWGITISAVDQSDPQRVADALAARRTALVWIETPSNPSCKIADIAAISALARQHGARTVVDNTWATPILQRPLALGADVVLHATTKYLGGHGDVTGGALVVRENDAWFARLRDVQKLGGGVPSPFDCWLVLRGMRTLAVRMRAHTTSAMQLAEMLSEHALVSRVHYPGLKSHPGHAVAARQMSGFGGMLSFEVRGNAAAALRAIGRLELITRATSLGGTESLIEHRASVEGPDSPTPDTLLRLSVGLEAVEDLIADLGRALTD